MIDAYIKNNILIRLQYINNILIHAMHIRDATKTHESLKP